MNRSKLVYKGRVINVYKEKVRLPDKRVREVDIVRHPGAVLIVPMLSDSKVIMLKQYRAVIGKYIYELPAGTLEKGELPLSCAKREITEEAGVKAKKVVKLGYIYPVPGYSTEKITIFKASGLKKAYCPGDEDEIIERVELTRQQIKGYFKKGLIVDAKTIAAFAFCGWL
ncbi:MAG TPA: NUDIX hydrolase [Candidatus Omnitrophota bacterium]|nr:NUDIX hydrolase [Candidatus Omnitrophota bacterium]